MGKVQGEAGKVISDKHRVGRLCGKHPDLGGLRYKSNGRCVDCALGVKPGNVLQCELVHLRTQVEGLQAELAALRGMHGQGAREFMEHYRNVAVDLSTRVDELTKENRAIVRISNGFALQATEMKVAALKVNKLSRDSDSLRYGDPSHGHIKRGYWDRTGKPCESCAAWDRMLKLARAK